METNELPEAIMNVEDNDLRQAAEFGYRLGLQSCDEQLGSVESLVTTLEEQLKAKDEYINGLTKHRDVLLAAAESDATTIKAKDEEIANLKTVMIAAAEEIQAHWQAHCDAEGYGPANLMHRLEKGIPAQYGYTAGAFMMQQELVDGQLVRINSLTSENERLRELIEELRQVVVLEPKMDGVLLGMCDRRKVGEALHKLFDSLLTETKPE